MTELSQPKKPHFSFASQELPELQCKLPLSAALKNSGRQICSCIIGILDKLKRNVSYDNRLEQEAINPSIPPPHCWRVQYKRRWREGRRGMVEEEERNDISSALPSPDFPQWLEALRKWWGRQLWECRGSAGSRQSQHRPIPLNPHSAHHRAACQNKAKPVCVCEHVCVSVCVRVAFPHCLRARRLTSDPWLCAVECVRLCIYVCVCACSVFWRTTCGLISERTRRMLSATGCSENLNLRKHLKQSYASCVPCVD